MRRVTQATGVAREAKPLLVALQPGESVTIGLPESVFWRREAYKHVSAVAAQVIGVGFYSMNARLIPGSVVVTRLTAPRSREDGEYGRFAGWARPMVLDQGP